MHQVHKLLRQYPPDCQPTRIESLGAAGGMSGALFWQIVAHRGTLILRRWPSEHPSPDRLRFIHAVLAHAERRGITFLPIPIKTCEGRSFLESDGRLWELAPLMPGTADFAEAPSVEKLSAAMVALAQFHVAVADFVDPLVPGAAAGSSAVMHRLARLRELVQGGREQLARAISTSIWPDFAPLAHQFLTALPRALPRAIALHEPLVDAPFSLQPCLRDIWHDHILFTDDKVTGVVDFGAMDVDTPACDVARLLGSLVGSDIFQRQIGLAAYATVRPLCADELQAVAAFDTSIVLLAGCNWIRWIYIDGRHFEDRSQVLQRFRRIVERTRMLA